jgi:hypothetical protein
MKNARGLGIQVSHMCYFLSDLFFNSPYNFFVYKHPITTVNYMLNHHITVLYIFEKRTLTKNLTDPDTDQ